MSERLVPDFKVTVNGAALPPDIESCLQWIEVKQSIRLLDMAALSFDNPAGLLADVPQFAMGAEVEVQVGYVGELSWAFKGDVVAVEPDFPVGGTPSVIVRAYDRVHRYRRGKKTRTFLNQTISAVIQTLAAESGLQADVESTSETQPYLLQSNQSNIEFIQELARRQGFEVFANDEGRKLTIKKPRTTGAKALSLAWGEGLKSFQVRKSTANVPTEVAVRYWDPVQKRMVQETCSALAGGLEPTSPAPKEVERAFGASKIQLSNHPASTPGEAKAVAAAAFNEMALDAVRGRGTCVGEPALAPGKVVEMLGLGKTWSGLYYVTSVTHLRDRRAGYTNEFTVARNGTGYAIDVPPLVEPVPPAAAPA